LLYYICDHTKQNTLLQTIFVDPSVVCSGYFERRDFIMKKTEKIMNRRGMLANIIMVSESMKKEYNKNNRNF